MSNEVERQRSKHITKSVTGNSNLISVGYIKNKIRLVDEWSI